MDLYDHLAKFMLSGIGLYILWAIWYATRPYKTTRTPPYKEAKSSILIKNDRRFVPNEEFCSICLTHSKWWTGGGSWAPDRCPIHNKGDGDVVLWKNMNIVQRNRAAKKFRAMWKDTFGVEYKFTVYEE